VKWATFPHIELLEKIIREKFKDKCIESPCDAAVGESGAYFRKYRGRDVFEFNFTDKKLESIPECKVNDTTLVMLPIEFKGEEVLHTVGGKDKDGALVSKLYRLTDAGWVESEYPPMKIARKQVASVCHKKRYLIVIGGIAEKAPSKAVEILDLVDGKWFKTAGISFEHCQLSLTHHMTPFYLLSHLASYGSKALTEAVKSVTSHYGTEDITESVQSIMKEFKEDMPQLAGELLTNLQPKQHELERHLLKQLGLYRMSACICDGYLICSGRVHQLVWAVSA